MVPLTQQGRSDCQVSANVVDAGVAPYLVVHSQACRVVSRRLNGYHEGYSVLATRKDGSKFANGKKNTIQVCSLREVDNNQAPRLQAAEPRATLLRRRRGLHNDQVPPLQGGVVQALLGCMAQGHANRAAHPRVSTATAPQSRVGEANDTVTTGRFTVKTRGWRPSRLSRQHTKRAVETVEIIHFASMVR